MLKQFSYHKVHKPGSALNRNEDKNHLDLIHPTIEEEVLKQQTFKK